MIVAEDSLCSNGLNKATTSVLSGKSYLAHFALPDEVGLASAAAHLVHFLNPSLAAAKPRREAFKHTNRLTLTQLG